MQRRHSLARSLGRGTLHIGRWVWYGFATVLVVLAIIFTAARIGLPALAEKTTEIERFISEKSTYPVRIGGLRTYWDGLRPGLQIQGLDIYSSSDMTEAMRLAEVRVSLKLIPLLWGEPRIESLIVVNPQMALERLTDGRLRITGFEPFRVGSGSGKGKLLPWLLQQEEIIIENGELQWFDHNDSQQAVYLSGININLHNRGEQHKFGVTARFPDEICRACSFILDISGNPITSKKWKGLVFIKAHKLNLAQLPTVVRDVLPEPLNGRFDVELWSRWQDGRLRSAQGEIQVSNLVFPLKALNKPVVVNKATAILDYKKLGEYAEFNLEDLWLGLSGPAWSAGHFRIARGPGGSTVEVGHVNVDDVTALLTSFEADNKFLKTVKTVRPGGDLYDLKLRVRDKGKVVDDYHLEARVEGVHSEAIRKIPGVKGINGHLSAEGRQGTFLLDANNVTVSAPYAFRAPIKANSVFARLNWVVESEYVQLIGKDMKVNGDDAKGAGEMELRIPFDRSKKPYFYLQANFRDGVGANVKRYYPINLLTSKTIAWLDSSIISGQVTAGNVVYKGNIADFPFLDGSGVFELRAKVRDGVFNYLPGWTPITDSEIDLHFKNSQMSIVSHRSRIGDLNVGKVVVRSKDLRKIANPLVEVAGTLEGPVKEALRVLQSSPTGKDQEWRSYLDTGVGVSGHGTLNLKLRIPVGGAAAYDMQGEYLVDKGNVKFKALPVSAQNVHGRVAFDKLGATEGELAGQFLGGDAVVKIDGQNEGNQSAILLSGRGTFTSAGLVELFPWRLTNYLQGNADWTGKMRLSRGRGSFRFESGLEGMKSTFPAPFDRPHGISEKLVLISEFSWRGRRELDLRIGEGIAAQFAFNEQADGWSFAQGAIGLGFSEVELPKMPGLHIRVRVGQIDADPWLEVFQSGGGAPPPFIKRVTADFDPLFFFNRPFGQLHIDLIRDEKVWIGEVAGDALDGRLNITEKPGKPAEINLDLAHLVIFEEKPGAQEINRNPRLFPTLTLNAETFVYKEQQLGKLNFKAAHTDLGWKIIRLDLEPVGANLFVHGDWLSSGEQQLTKLDLQFSSVNMGETLGAYGATDQIMGGKVQINAELSWQGSPMSPDLATVNGTVELSAEDGRLLKIGQGAGRIFGLLDFSSIGKILTLDFGPLFGKGLPFKTLNGDISIANGDASTSNTLLVGSAMQISINGRAGLAAEDFDFAIQVHPRLGTNIGLWGILGPQGGVLLLALEKLFKKQFSRGARITYMVTGPWDDPKINRLGQQKSSPEELEDMETGGN